MPYCIVKICKPSNTFYPNIFSAILIYTASCRMERIVIRNIKLPISTMNTCAEPYFVIFDKRKNLLIRNCVDIPNNQKILLICNELSNILSKQAKRRICHNNIGLFQIRNTFLAAEVPVTFQLFNASFFGFQKSVNIFIGYTTSICHRHFPDVHNIAIPSYNRLIFIIEQRKLLPDHRRSAIGGTDQPLQAEIVKISQEEFTEITFKRVIAVAKNGFPSKVLLIMVQFVLYILILRIELVFFASLALCRFSFFAICISSVAIYGRFL